jgi:hypothetical protein
MRTPKSHSIKPARKRWPRAKRWAAAGLLGASVAFSAPKAHAREIAPRDTAHVTHLLHSSTSREIKQIIPLNVQREFKEAKTAEQRRQILNSRLTAIEKRRLMVALRNELESNPEIQSLVEQSYQSTSKLRQRTTAAALVAVIAFVLGIKTGSELHKRKKPVKVRLVK